MRLRLAAAIPALAGALVLAQTGAAQPPPSPEPEAAAPGPLPPSGDPDDAVEPDDQLRPIGEPETDPSKHAYFPLNFSLIYPLATNVGDPNRATNIDLGILYTKVGYIHGGAQIGLIAGVTQQMAGAQIGLAAVSEGPTYGAQIAGAFALSDAPFDGAQIAGLFAWSRFRFNGLQVAGAVNQARKHFAGVQIAGGVNVARKTVHGVQVAGLLNIGAVNGLQLAPVNISSEVKGVQIGLVNIARKVKGFQIGLINIADDVDGESVGVASVPRAGGVHGVAWGSNSLYGNFGVKFASLYTYSMFSGSFHFERNGKDKLLAPGFTFGLYRPVLLDGLYVHADLGVYRPFLIEGPQRVHDELFKTRLLVRYALARHLSLFVGGGAYLRVISEAPFTRFGPELDAGVEL
jgi:hypothetical protein